MRSCSTPSRSSTGREPRPRRFRPARAGSRIWRQRLVPRLRRQGCCSHRAACPESSVAGWQQARGLGRAACVRRSQRLGVEPETRHRRGGARRDCHHCGRLGRGGDRGDGSAVTSYRRGSPDCASEAREVGGSDFSAVALGEERECTRRDLLVRVVAIEDLFRLLRRSHLADIEQKFDVWAIAAASPCP